MLHYAVMETENAEWGSPVVLVRKFGDPCMRYGVNYGELNSVTVQDSYPIPRIEKSIYLVRDTNVPTTLDTGSVYCEMEIH